MIYKTCKTQSFLNLQNREFPINLQNLQNLEFQIPFKPLSNSQWYMFLNQLIISRNCLIFINNHCLYTCASITICILLQETFVTEIYIFKKLFSSMYSRQKRVFPQPIRLISLCRVLFRLFGSHCWRQLFVILSIYKPSMWSSELTKKSLEPIGLAVLTYIGYENILRNPFTDLPQIYWGTVEPRKQAQLRLKVLSRIGSLL